MPVHVVVGGQFGSEGKGKVALHLARELDAHISVKVSGINAGHTVLDARGRPHIFRILPAATVTGDVTCVLAPGCCFRPSLLLEELEREKAFNPRVLIHPNAGIITEEMAAAEKSSGLVERIGSTGTGTGEVAYHRAACDGEFVGAKDVPELAPYVVDTSEWMRERLDRGADIIVEGAQGYGLSVLGSYWPYCTSRDTTAAGFVAEAGLSPRDVRTIAMVIRSYPIRVGGNSGPLPHETTWERVTAAARSPTPIREYTSVTRRLRRVAEFDPALVREAQSVNQANVVVLNFLDYVWDEEPGTIGPNRRAFLDMIAREAECPVTHVGFGPDSVVPVEDATP